MQTAFASVDPVSDMDCNNFLALHLKLRAGHCNVSAARFEFSTTHFKCKRSAEGVRVEVPRHKVFDFGYRPALSDAA